MCRQGGYYEQAAYLAEQHEEIDLVVDILVEDSKNYDEALSFIWQQDPETVCILQVLLLCAHLARIFTVGIWLIAHTFRPTTVS